MEYGAYLIAVLLIEKDVFFKELEHDLQFEKAIKLHNDFINSKFNDENISEYDCILKFLKNIKYENS